jgi:hypothetical protein
MYQMPEGFRARTARRRLSNLLQAIGYAFLASSGFCNIGAYAADLQQ